MIVLVAYATRHGSTAGIAERIAVGLRRAGLTATVSHVEDVREVTPYDAVVLGGAVLHVPLAEGRHTVRPPPPGPLRERPVWLFSSGPLGTDLVDDEGHDVLEASRPREFDELTTLLQPRGEKVFFGAYDPDAPPVGLGERMVRHLPAARTRPPGGRLP